MGSNPSTTCNAVHAIIYSLSHVSNTVTGTCPPAQPPTTRNPNLFNMSNPAKHLCTHPHIHHVTSSAPHHTTTHTNEHTHAHTRTLTNTHMMMIVTITHTTHHTHHTHTITH